MTWRASSFARANGPPGRATLARVPPELSEIIPLLRRAGARFAFLHGSRADGSARSDSELDVAAWWQEDAPQAFDVLLPAGVDLLVLNTAPLELAGRVAQRGRLLFDDDPVARVRWLPRPARSTPTSSLAYVAATTSRRGSAPWSMRCGS